MAQSDIKNQRILCLQPSSVFERYGGAEYYFDDLLTNTAKVLGKGQVRTLVPKRGDGFALSERPYSIEAVRFTKRGIRGKIENRYSTDFFWTAFANINEFKPSLLICAHVSLAPLTMALSRLTKVPYYVIALGIETWGNLWPQDEFALRQAHGIISISHCTKQILVERGLSESKISVIHPTVNETFGDLPSPQRRVDLTLPLKLLTLSRLDSNEKYKGQDHVLGALKLLKVKNPALPVKYTIQGDGSDKERLQKLSVELGLEHTVEFKPAIKDRDLLTQTYKEHDVFVMPSRFGKWDRKWHGEGFGIVYVEAAMLGIPSIAYDCGGAKDIIQTGETGLLVPQNDIVSLSNSIELLANDRELLNRLGAKAYQVAKQKFGANEMQQSLSNLFLK